MNAVLMTYGEGFRVELLVDLRITTRGHYFQGVFLK